MQASDYIHIRETFQMTIKTVKAISKNDMKKYLNKDNSFIQGLVAAHDDVWIITICNPDSVPLLETKDKVLSLCFEDYDPVSTSPWLIGENSSTGLVPFDEQMAEEVCRFVHKANNDDSSKEDLLLVNCSAGISRSGAVIDFTRRVLNLDYNIFKRLNSKIVPNVYVLNLLHQCWGKMNGV